MKKALRVTGLVLASLTIATVALAQQGGGGRGGDGGGNGGGGDQSILQVLREDQARPRLTRAVERRGALSNCTTHACTQSPPPARRPRVWETGNACAGGEVLVVRSRGGQIVRYVCEYP